MTFRSFEHISKSGTFQRRRDWADELKKTIENARIAAADSSGAAELFCCVNYAGHGIEPGQRVYQSTKFHLCQELSGGSALHGGVARQNGNVTTGADRFGSFLWEATAYWHWANIELGQRFTALADRGVGGDTTTMMAARFDANVLGLNPLPGWLVFEPGPNDYTTSVSAATTIANITQMIDKATNAGIRVALCTTTPSTHITVTASKQDRSMVNHWIKNTAPTLWPGLVVVDWTAHVSNPADGTPNTAYFKNESNHYVHPNNHGARIMVHVSPPLWTL